MTALTPTQANRPSQTHFCPENIYKESVRCPTRVYMGHSPELGNHFLFARETALAHYADPNMTEPLALVVYEKLLPGSQLVNRLQDLKYRVQTVADPTQL